MAAFQTAFGKTALLIRRSCGVGEKARTGIFLQERILTGPPRAAPGCTCCCSRLLGAVPVRPEEQPRAIPHLASLFLHAFSFVNSDTPCCDGLPSPSGVENSPRAGALGSYCSLRDHCYPITEERIKVGTLCFVPKREGKVWSLSRVLVTSAPNPALHILSADRGGSRFTSILCLPEMILEQHEV